MKVTIERCEHAQAFQDRCMGRAIRDGKEKPCFFIEESDGDPNLTLTICDGSVKHVYVLTPEQQQLIYEPSKELAEFEVNEEEDSDHTGHS